MAVVFILLSPFLLIEPATAWRDIVANRQIVVDRGVTSGAFAPALRYVEILWTDSMGLPAILLGLVGAIWMIAAQPARAALLLAFPVPFFLFITNTVPASRYLNPILPFVALFGGWAASMMAERSRVPPPAFWAAVVLAGAARLDRQCSFGHVFPAGGHAEASPRHSSRAASRMGRPLPSNPTPSSLRRHGPGWSRR